MDITTLVIFVLVYLGMFLGEIPGLALDRTGVALLGAIALVATERVSINDAWRSVDVTTLALLFGLMVVSAQFRLGGFYGRVAVALAGWQKSPAVLLAGLIALTGVLSALLANDVVCLAMAPILTTGCAKRGRDPVPFLLALACAANVGSAATLIGNPQNMLIGQTLHLSFAGYLADAALPSLLGLLAVWAIITFFYKGRWERPVELTWAEHRAAYDGWQTAKGALVLAAVIGAFLFLPVPREAVALGATGMLLLSRRMASREILGQVDWHLLVLFVGLFVVNHALLSSGMLERWTASAHGAGVHLDRGPWLFAIAAALSNLVSNVPAVMLLLPAAKHPMAGAILALSSTLAGNLLVVGSIANIIVLEQAARQGVRISWREHARVGVPVTLATLAMAAGWLAVRAPW